MRHLLFLAVLLLPANANAQVSPDAAMAQVAERAPLFQRARHRIVKAIGRLEGAEAKRLTRAALLSGGDCVRHRIGLDREAQRKIVGILAARGFLDAAHRTMAGMEEAREQLFPPLPGDGSACPHPGLSVLAAAGGNSGSHHSWPGGLAEHIATNLASATALLHAYRAEGAQIDGDSVVGAVLWHDWAKALVLRWQIDGNTTPELRVAGTGTHHILGLAEAMRRGLPARWIAAQACAHGAPEGEDRSNVSNWIEAAAIVAGEDPARFPARGSPECLISYLSDQNWAFGDAAIVAAEARLAIAAAQAGFDPADRPRYNLCYRNPVLARLGADAVFASGERVARPITALPIMAPRISPCLDQRYGPAAVQK
ncbi:MAG: hypothetical protein J7530_18925 [Novosphingobium sp.]|nr:hypothetical protein [Novosphingobium sp.]